MIIDGLPAGTEIILDTIHLDFICRKTGGPNPDHCGTPDPFGGGGESETFDSNLELRMTGTGALGTFSRSIALPALTLTSTGPRGPGNAVFPTEMVALQANLPAGDPDFDMLQIVVGPGNGLPASPGETTLLQLGPPGSDFQVDSFFDITYRIDFQGTPGGSLNGLGGSTTGTLRMEARGIGGPCLPNATQTACEPTACADTTQRCQPSCVLYNAAQGLLTVDACECRGPDECHVQAATAGVVAPAAAGGGTACVIPDPMNTGTISLPPAGCDYLSPEDVHMIIDGLPPGNTIELAPIHTQFICQKGGAGACSVLLPPGACEGVALPPATGNVDCFDSQLQLQLTGLGPQLGGFNRLISIPVFSEVRTDARTPGDAVQDFDTDMFRLEGEIFGDPDFDLLRVTGGTANGLPSPGHTTLTRTGPPGSSFSVDSFFDITYRIEFQGAPGSILQGMSGTTTATIRMKTGAAPTCAGVCPAGTVCQESITDLGGGTVQFCCDCVAEPTGACCGTDGTCSVTTALACAGTYLGDGSVCGGVVACCLPDGTCQDVDAACCAFFGGVAQPAPSDCATTACPQPACEPDPVSPNGCSSIVCPTPGERCSPTCAVFDPVTGVVVADLCECRDPNECQLNLGTGPVAAGAGNPCVVADPMATGTVSLPPAGCEYLSPDEVHMIVDGLPAGTTIELAPIHRDFICNKQGAGGACSTLLPPGDCEGANPDGSGGNIDCFQSTLELQVTGTGALAGFNRLLNVFTACEIHTDPRTPGDVVQDFDTDMFRCQGEIFGDPDFDVLRVTTGSANGLPSPGHTTLTRLPGGDFAVDSFFDITYRIEFQGAPGSVLEGMGGTTTATLRMETGTAPACVGTCPVGTVCEQSNTSQADGTLRVCCNCVPIATGACCGTDGTCSVTTATACQGTYLGDGVACGGVVACCLPDGTCQDADAACCSLILGGTAQGAGSDCATTACPQPACEPDPTTANGCSSVVCPTDGERCSPTCAVYDPLTGVVRADLCECRDPNECRVDLGTGPVAAGAGNPCVVAPDPLNPGTIVLPPAGCDYLSPDEVHAILDGLPPGNTIELAPIHKDFICNKTPGGPGMCSQNIPPGLCEMTDASGGTDCFNSSLDLQVTGTGPQLGGFSRMLSLPFVFVEIHTDPRTPGDAVQDFDTEMVQLQGELFGDPDFCTLKVTAGSANNLPSPGHTTLTELPGGNFQVDSFFDITYRIEFQGCPGSRLDGMSGVTTATLRMETGTAPTCVGDCPPGTMCEQTNTPQADGIQVCCKCIDIPTGACCRSDGTCGVTTAVECQGTYLGDNSVCTPTSCTTARPCRVDADCIVDNNGVALPGISSCDYWYCDLTLPTGGLPGSCASCARDYGQTCPLFATTVGVGDILCAIGGFSDYFACPNGDVVGGTGPGGPLGPSGPNGLPLSVSDILAIVGAFSGANPPACPETEGLPRSCDNLTFAPAGACGNSATSAGSSSGTASSLSIDGSRSAPLVSDDVVNGDFVLVPRQRTARAGGFVDVDVFVSGVEGLVGFEMGVHANGGRRGGLTLDSITVDTQRSDYVFNGLYSFPAIDSTLGRLGGALMGSGVDVAAGDRAYVGTFRFAVSADAAGAFNVAVSMEFAGLWTDGNRKVAVNPVSDAAVMIAAPSRK
jgi:hypothetical protein